MSSHRTGAFIPDSVRGYSGIAELQTEGLRLLRQGKVRDIYSLPGQPDLLLFVASNRVSIFDFVLSSEVASKGEVLTALWAFWLTSVLDVPTHLVAYGNGIDAFLPRALQGKLWLRSRATVVRRLEMLPVECVVRGYLTGGGLRTYNKTGQVCGHVLPPGLRDGDKLPEPIFTPTTKSETDHDEDLPREAVLERYGDWPERKSIELYDSAQRYAFAHGVIIADTKLEFGTDGTLADECFTPDSSRFWLYEDWQQSCLTGTPPPSYDKEVVRAWGLAVKSPFRRSYGARFNLNELSPKNEAHRQWVASNVKVPADVLEQTTGRYLEIFKRISGVRLDVYQDTVMGIRSQRKEE